MVTTISLAGPPTASEADANSLNKSAGNPNQYTTRLPSRRNSGETNPLRNSTAPKAISKKVGARTLRISTPSVSTALPPRSRRYFNPKGLNFIRR